MPRSTRSTATSSRLSGQDHHRPDPRGDRRPVKVIENPLAKAEPIVLKKSRDRRAEEVADSIMPKGLLDKLTREEILDLVAYVVGRGDMKATVYSGGHEHGH